MILIIQYLISFSLCQLLDTFPDTSQTLAIFNARFNARCSRFNEISKYLQ